MGRSVNPPRIYRRKGRKGWFATLGRGRRNISMKTENETEALSRLAHLVASPPLHETPTVSTAYRRLREAPCVYFIQAGIGGSIKIGRTKNLKRRLDGFATAHDRKLMVLGLLPDQPGLEQQMHALFHKERLEGEWFRPSLELFKFISMHTVRPR